MVRLGWGVVEVDNNVLEGQEETKTGMGDGR